MQKNMLFAVALLGVLVAPAQAQISSFPPGTFNSRAALTPASGGGGSPVTVTFVTNANVEGATSTYLATSIGTADANRVVVVGVCARMNSAGDGITTVKLHVPDVATDPTGTTLTAVSGSGSGSANLAITQLFYAPISSGTSGTIIVVFGGAGVARNAIAVWSVVTATQTPSDGQANTGVGTGLTKSVNVPSNGGAVGFYMVRTGSGTTTWTNATKSFDGVVGSNNTTSDSGATVTGTGSISVTAVATASPPFPGDALSLAAWGP